MRQKHFDSISVISPIYPSHLTLWYRDGANIRSHRKSFFRFLPPSPATGEELSIYGVRLEVWKIGDSVPAVNFNVLCKPSALSAGTVTNVSSGELSETRKMQFAFWEQLRDSLSKTRELPSLQSPKPRYWYDIALGRSGFHLSCIADTSGKRIGVRVFLTGRYGGAQAIRLLSEQKTDIKKELGFHLNWDPHPEKKDRTITIDQSATLENRNMWPE